MSSSSDGGAVLIPANMSASALECVRSLNKRGVQTIVASEHRYVPAAYSKYCDESTTVPSPHEDLLAYKEAILGIAKRPDVRTILPIREEDIFILTKHAAEFDEYVSVPVPSFEALRTVHDNYLLAEIAEEVGVPMGRTQRFEDVDDWNRELIVKSRYAILTADYVDSHSARECDKLQGRTRQLEPGVVPDREAMREEMLGHDPIVQEYVPAEHEYMFGALYDQGKEVASWQQRYRRRKTYGGGGSVYREAIADSELEEAGRALLDALDWNGIACVEFMKDAETGEYKLTEINPRLWMSLPCAVRAGADFPYYLWLLATRRADEIEPRYELGTTSHLLYGEFTHLTSILREEYPLTEKPSFISSLLDVSRSFIRDPYFDFLDIDDPLPFAVGIAVALHLDRLFDQSEASVDRSTSNSELVDEVER